MVTIFGVDRAIDVPEDVFPSDQGIIDEIEKKSSDRTCIHGWFDSCYRGVKLHYRKWLPSMTPKAIVIFAHGIQSHSGNGHVLPDGRRLNGALRVDAFVRSGYAVYSHDYYGHGYSEGTRWWIPETWENNLADYESFVSLVAQENDTKTPIILMGESYGSCLTLHLARKFQEEGGPSNFDSVILTSSAIDADLPPYIVQLILRHVVAPVFPTWIPFFMPNPVSPDRIWRDPIALAAGTDPEKLKLRMDSGGTPMRLGTAANILDAMMLLKTSVIPGFQQPYCLIHGTHDFSCPMSGAEYLWENSSTPESEREFHKMEGMYHDLFSDLGSDEVIDIVLGWTEKRLSKNFNQE